MGADQQAAVVTSSKLLHWPRLMPGRIMSDNDFADNGYGDIFGMGFGYGNGYGNNNTTSTGNGDGYGSIEGSNDD